MQIKIGKIVNTQGIKGEVRILSNSDFKDIRFKKGERLILKTKDGDKVLQIESSRPHKTFQLIKFVGYENINDVMQFKNIDVYGPEIKGEELPEGEYLNRDLVDCQVFDQDDNQLGLVQEVIENPAHNMLRVVKGKTRFLVPFNEEFIISVNIKDKKIYIEVIPGLIE